MSFFDASVHTETHTHPHPPTKKPLFFLAFFSEWFQQCFFCFIRLAWIWELLNLTFALHILIVCPVDYIYASLGLWTYASEWSEYGYELLHKEEYCCYFVLYVLTCDVANANYNDARLSLKCHIIHASSFNDLYHLLVSVILQLTLLLLMMMIMRYFTFSPFFLLFFLYIFHCVWC